MQIDFHHAATYAVARLAGFGHGQAVTIAYASQYVDDSVNRGTVRFDNGETYERIASAHKMLDVLNTYNPEDYQVWLPFHFLPGNNGSAEGAVEGVPLAQRLICTPDSPLANALWTECRAQKNTANALHRLGITTHVYCDTFSHQGFAGLRHEVNKVETLSDFSHLLENVQSRIKGLIANLSEIGHGGALTCPDLPFLTWNYKDWSGAARSRSNAPLFLTAMQRLFQQYVYYLGHDAATVMSTADQSVIEELIEQQSTEDEQARHAAWMQAISDGRFSFGGLTREEYAGLRYAAYGEGSWRQLALGISDQHDPQEIMVHYDHRFENSDWKHFHDALREHEQFVLGNLLPAYGLPGSYDEAHDLGL